MKEPIQIEKNVAYIAPQPDDDYPEVRYQIKAQRPKGLKDAWRVLWGKLEPRLLVHRPMNLRMADDALKESYLGPIKEQLNWGRDE